MEGGSLGEDGEMAGGSGKEAEKEIRCVTEYSPPFSQNFGGKKLML